MVLEQKTKKLMVSFKFNILIFLLCLFWGAVLDPFSIFYNHYFYISKCFIQFPRLFFLLNKTYTNIKEIYKYKIMVYRSQLKNIGLAIQKGKNKNYDIKFKGHHQFFSLLLQDHTLKPQFFSNIQMSNIVDES